MLVKGVVADHIPSWAACYHHSLPKNAAMKRGRGRILDASRRGMSHKKGWATKRTSHKKGWATKRKEFFCNNDGESFCFCFENTMRTTSYSQTVSLLSCSCLPCLLVIGNSGHLLCCSLLVGGRGFLVIDGAQNVQRAATFRWEIGSSMLWQGTKQLVICILVIAIWDNFFPSSRLLCRIAKILFHLGTGAYIKC